jgi:hypothetical protein
MALSPVSIAEATFLLFWSDRGVLIICRVHAMLFSIRYSHDKGWPNGHAS